MNEPDFASLGLDASILRALTARGYTTPTPIQARTIPHLLDGRDLLGIAQTGTGKTAAFALPMLQLLAERRVQPRPNRPRALVLAPTRELATQIADACIAYGKALHLSIAIVFGGVGQTPQVQALRRGIDILVATPGRLLDLIQQGYCDLGAIEILVLDEADRMLDMGFLPDVRRILAKLPDERQSLLFSATMPADVTALARNILHEPLRVEVTPPAATADRVEQSVYLVAKAKKRDLLVELLADPVFVRTLVFTRTKHGADRVARTLQKADIPAHAIHGNKSQGARERALEDFRSGRAPVLVATDIAARGIDVKEITHVVNFDLPNVPESYVHRIGRTARAGRAGIAISFCDEEEHDYLRDIEKLIRQRLPRSTWRPGQAVKPPESAEPRREPAAERTRERATADRDDPWAEAREAAAAERPKQRQRPAPRQQPGPYEPSPQKRRPSKPGGPQPAPRHDGPRQGSGKHGSGQQGQRGSGQANRGSAPKPPHGRPQRSRPATPNLTEPARRPPAPQGGEPRRGRRRRR